MLIILVDPSPLIKVDINGPFVFVDEMQDMELIKIIC